MTMRKRYNYRGPRLAGYTPRRKAADVVWLGVEALGTELLKADVVGDVVSVLIPAFASDDEFDVVAAIVEDKWPGVELEKLVDPPAWRFAQIVAGR